MSKIHNDIRMIPKAKKSSFEENKSTSMGHSKQAATKDISFQDEEKKEIIKTLLPEELHSEVDLKKIRYRQNPKTTEIFVEIVDAESGDVLRVIPEQEFVKVTEKMKAQSGAFLNIHG